MSSITNILSIYDNKYANKYDDLYLIPWKTKHDINIKLIQKLLGKHASDEARWLDICCGQAWHFSQFPNRVKKIGLDASMSQLKKAASRNADATFIQADAIQMNFSEHSFELTTCFWAAYCYLDSYQSIDTLLTLCMDWLSPGGSLYFDVLLPNDLKTFNESDFSKQTGFQVTPRTPDYTKWLYKDIGGIHNMTSPPLEFFINTLSKHSDAIETVHDSGFMTHLIATAKN